MDTNTAYIIRLQQSAKRNREMVKLRAGGWSLGKLAQRYGISRARVHQITQRAAT